MLYKSLLRFFGRALRFEFACSSGNSQAHAVATRYRNEPKMNMVPFPNPLPSFVWWYTYLNIIGPNADANDVKEYNAP